jgi:hypothetical protein
MTPNVGNQFGVNIVRARHVELQDIVVDGAVAGLHAADSDHVGFSKTTVLNSKGLSAKFFRTSLSLTKLTLVNSGPEVLLAEDCSKIDARAVYIRTPPLAVGDSRKVRFSGIQRGSVELFGVDLKHVQNDSRELTVLTRG